MGLGRRIVFGVACAFALVVVQAAVAATPPKAKDPCVSGTKDICGTTGVGYYKTYSFGTRWFGDFKNAIPGGTHSYCIDLRFWYPGPSYKYKEDTSGNLTNKSGGAVPFPNQQRIAYAIWVYGRSNDPDQAAAVMLYVHGQIDDARPGEVSPSVLGSKARSLYDQITKAAAKFHGPYKVDVSVPGTPKVGTAVTATVRVLAAGGAAVPNLPVTVSTTGATDVSKPSKTDDSGVAKVTLTPSGGALKVSASSSALPSTLPRVFVPTSAAAAANGQRLVLPASQTVSDSGTGTASKVQIKVSTNAAPAALLVGKPSQDKVTISNAGGGWSGTIQVRIYGPERTAAAIACTGTPVVQGTLSAKGNGTFTTTAVAIKAPGWYAYQETVPGDASTIGLTTPCNAPSERFRVDTQPAVVTTVSSQSVAARHDDHGHGQGHGPERRVGDRHGGALRPVPDTRGDRLHGHPRLDGNDPGHRRRHVHDRGRHRADPRLLHLPRVDRSLGIRPGRPDGLRGHGRDGDRDRPAEDRHPDQRAEDVTRRDDHGQGDDLGPRRARRPPSRSSSGGRSRPPARSGAAARRTGRARSSPRATAPTSTAPVKLTKAGYYTYQESIADTPAYGAFTAPCARARPRRRSRTPRRRSRRR